MSSPSPEALDVRELSPGGKRASWARAAGLSVDLLNSIASERRALTVRTTKALAGAAHVPE